MSTRSRRNHTLAFKAQGGAGERRLWPATACVIIQRSV